MINWIKNGDQPLLTVTQVSIAGATSSEQPPLKDKSMWSDQEKKIQKIDRLARSLLIQGLPNNIYSLIDSNKTAKDLYDALEMHMLGSEYGEQDRKATVLYEYKTFKATERELLLKTYIRYLQYATMMRQNKNLLDINIDALYNIFKQNQGDVNDAMKSKKKAVVITSDPLALVAEQTKSDDKKEEKKVDEKKRDMRKFKCYNCKKEGHFAKDCKKEKVKDYEYYKTKMLLAKKDKDEQVLLAEDHAWMESKESSSSKDETIAEDKMYNGKKGIGFENTSYICKAKDLRPTLYDERVIGLGYTSRFLIHSDEALEIEKFKRARENKIEFAYDYGSLNASYVNEKINFLDDYFQEIINLDFLKIDSSFQMFKLSVLQSVSPILVLKTSCTSNNVEKKTKRKRRNKNSSKQHDKQANKDVLRANKAFVYFLDLDTFSSVRRPKVSNVEWKKKGSSNTSKDNLSFDNHSNLNKNVKRYSHKDLMSCNNSYFIDTQSAFVCNNAMNASCNARMHVYDDVNDLFVFDDVCLRQSHVSKMHFRKKPRASLNIHSRSKLNKSLSRIVSKWLPKVQPLAEHIAKWIPRVKRQIVKITKTSNSSGCSKHMMGNRALLTNFVERFLGTVRFGNNDFAVIVGYENVVIGSMTIKRVYYVEGLVFDSLKTTKLPTSNVETSNIEGEVFHEVSESFQMESSSFLINNDVQQSSEEVIVPQTNTQSISNDMIPNVNDASS
nr:hypothetical protein [Tanacetum cinerariifolium]